MAQRNSSLVNTMARSTSRILRRNSDIPSPLRTRLVPSPLIIHGSTTRNMTLTCTTGGTTIRWFGDLSSSSSSERAFEGVSDEVSKRIHHHAHQPQTAVSLRTLLQTGRGEFLHKTYKNLEEDNNDRGATGKVLIQVSIWVHCAKFCGSQSSFAHYLSMSFFGFRETLCFFAPSTPV
jgi:hypothetical protein